MLAAQGKDGGGPAALAGASVDCWVRRRYCLVRIMKLGERVAKNTKLE